VQSNVKTLRRSGLHGTSLEQDPVTSFYDDGDELLGFI
jgi:hypothetical protein